ncbi:MAG: dihydroorotase [Limnochordales bacterium]|nr:dihydroorotase [Limnochordales bacterium]
MAERSVQAKGDTIRAVQGAADATRGWLLKGGRVVDPANNVDGKADVLILNGKVVEVGPDLPRPAGMGEVRELDCDGLVVLPGLVDMHVHLREPGQERKETIASGARAALAGGFTSIACMPNTDPPLDTAAAITYVREKATAARAARVYPIGAITKGRRGEELAPIGEMVEAGAVAVSDDGLPVANASLLRHALEYSRRWGIPVIEHCDDPTLAPDGVMNEGPVSLRLGLRGMPAEGEVSWVFRDCLLARLAGGRLHIAHLSAAGSVEVVRWAKSQGIAVTAEVTPHHLLLTDELVASSGYDTSTKVNPPLRSEADRQAVLTALQEGVIDCIASDHAPHMEEEKNREYDLAPFGMVGLETTLALVMTRLIDEGYLSWSAAVERLAVAPARILRLPGGAGTLSPGAMADVVVVDPRAEWVVDPARFYSRGRNTPFAGWKLRGQVVYGFVGGELRFDRTVGGFLD